jgi:hypothetical protein
MSIIKRDVYSLKWDENGLRDKTLNEIRRDADTEIKCPCLNRYYSVTTGSIIKHFSTNVHIDWVNTKKNEHVKEFGTCCSPEQTIDFLLKDNRELKKLIVKLTSKNKNFEDTISDFKRNIAELSLKTTIEDNTLN